MTVCRLPTRIAPAVRRTRPRRRCRARATRLRSTTCGGRYASPSGPGDRPATGRRPVAPDTSSHGPPRGRGWSATCPPAYATRRRRRDRPPLPGARRSGPHSRRPSRDRAARSLPPADGATLHDRPLAAIRRPPCGSAGCETRTPRSGVNLTWSISSACTNSVSAVSTVQHRRQVGAEPQSDDGCCVQRLLGRRAEAVDAGGDRRLQRRRHADHGGWIRAPVRPALASKHSPVGKVAHDLLGEERIARRPISDLRRQSDHRGVGPQQFGDEVRCFRIIERRKGDQLSAERPAQRTAIFRPVRESTRERVCGMTVRNSASSDSLTSSIQCASSMT